MATATEISLGNRLTTLEERYNGIVSGLQNAVTGETLREQLVILQLQIAELKTEVAEVKSLAEAALDKPL